MGIEITIYRKAIINRSFWMAAGIAIVFVVLGQKSYALGIIIGVFIAAVNFFLLSLQVSKLAKGKRMGNVLGSFLIRYALLGVCIFLVMKQPMTNIFGFLIGYFVLQINIFISQFTTKLNKSPKKETETSSQEASS